MSNGESVTNCESMNKKGLKVMFQKFEGLIIKDFLGLTK